MVFYRKYRPQKLSDVVGQDHITKTLLAQLENGKISHGYLFAGPRGTGKTSTARILAKAINCQRLASSGEASRKDKLKNYTLNANSLDAKFAEPCNQCQSCVTISGGSHLDLIEIDAASNRGIDEIRDLREKIKLAPISARFKVYIIDEAHMLTSEAFNALLKTLEEPPAHAVFILCTTEPQKLPATITSRLIKFNFGKASDAALSIVIEKIAKNEDIKITNEAIIAIAKSADGSFRDATSTLDQLSAQDKKINEEDVKKIVRASSFTQIYTFTESLAGKDLKSAVNLIEELSLQEIDIATFVRETILFFEKLLLIKIGANQAFSNEENGQKIKSLSQNISFTDIQGLMKLFLVAEGETKLYPLPQISLILAVCKYCGLTQIQAQIESVTNPDENLKSEPKILKSGKSQNEKSEDEKRPKTSRRSADSISQIQDHWEEFLNKVKSKNAHVVALLRSTRPYEFLNDKLTIEVFYRFHKEKLEEQKIIIMLEETLSEIIGKRLAIKFILAERKAKPTPTVATSDVVEIDQDELAKLAQEIFSK